MAASPAHYSSSGGILGCFKGSFCLKILYCFLSASVVYHASLYCDQACCIVSVLWQEEQMLRCVKYTNVRKVC